MIPGFSSRATWPRDGVPEASPTRAPDRSPAAKSLTGRIPHLNGGLFLPHKLELDANRALRLGTTLRVAEEDGHWIAQTVVDV